MRVRGYCLGEKRGNGGGWEQWVRDQDKKYNNSQVWKCWNETHYLYTSLFKDADENFPWPCNQQQIHMGPVLLKLFHIFTWKQTITEFPKSISKTLDPERKWYVKESYEELFILYQKLSFFFFFNIAEHSLGRKSAILKVEKPLTCSSCVRFWWWLVPKLLALFF